MEKQVVLLSDVLLKCKLSEKKESFYSWQQIMYPRHSLCKRISYTEGEGIDIFFHIIPVKYNVFSIFDDTENAEDYCWNYNTTKQIWYKKESALR